MIYYQIIDSQNWKKDKKCFPGVHSEIIQFDLACMMMNDHVVIGINFPAKTND